MPLILIFVFFAHETAEKNINNDVFEIVAYSMQDAIDLTAIEVIVHNSLVAICLWLIAMLPWLILKNKKQDKKTIIFIAFMGHVAFFVKEGIRMGLIVNQGFLGLHPMSIFLTLIFPHALFELPALIIVSVLSFCFLISLYDKNTLRLRCLLIPLVFLIVAGIIETHVTPAIFSNYLINYL